MIESITSKIPKSLASSLEPVLKKQTDNRLGDIHWFRTDWQRGGAATGFSTWQNDEQDPINVVVKLPIVQKELRWTRRLQDTHGVAPLILASAENLGGYDLAWMIIERFPVGPLGKHWEDSHIDRIADAAARFTLSTIPFPVDQAARSEDWDKLLKLAKKSLRENHIKDNAKWKKTHSILSKNLGHLLEIWRGRSVDQWLHGDLHMANAMCRSDAPDAEVSLIDLAEVHAGHWVEDAVYLERQLWGHKTRLNATKPVHAMAVARKHHGLDVEDDYSELVDVRRLLLAATATAFMQSEGDPRYLTACLGQLETTIDRLHLK